MPFEFKKLANHDTNNPIVARLSLQNLQILEKCKVTKEVKDKVGGLYLDSLMKKLLRCWEIQDSFKKSFAEAAAKYKPPATPNAAVEIPQIDRLQADCHNFLYETKNYIRDVLYVVNKLYGTASRASTALAWEPLLASSVPLSAGTTQLPEFAGGLPRRKRATGSSAASLSRKRGT